MADIIHLLPESVANQIAAGEVVQRPASVVKELIENAIDAGAQNISLTIKDAGKTYIQVRDDGCGMSETDARMSFERHATSKIFKATDLYNIRTLGFRGEALASIASVSRVELKTRRKEDEIGTMVIVEGASLLTHEPLSCLAGTTVIVKNLFFNITVRKNFLKSNNIEYRHIVEEFLHVALVYPEIRFIMVNETQEVYHLPKGSLRQRITGIFGKKYDTALVPIEEHTPIATIKGFIGKPENAKRTKGEQYLFVNGRFIRNAYFNHAIFSAYEGLLPEDSFPFYTILLELPSERIDVNVHPTKTEVKFEDEKAIYSIVKAGVKRSLSQHHVVPSLDFEQEPIIKKIFDEAEIASKAPRIKIDFLNETFKSADRGRTISKKSAEKDWAELLEVLKNKENTRREESVEVQTAITDTETDDFETETGQKVIQVHSKYILSTLQSGILIIHQQYAHQRILYEEYLEAIQKGGSASQKQLFPEVLEMSEMDFHVFQEVLPALEKIGFLIEPFGKRSFIINGIPVALSIGKPTEFLEKTFEDYKNSLGVQGTPLFDKLAQALAVQTSVKEGDRLSIEEMTLIIDKLFACSNPYYSPKGKPVFMKIGISELDKKFD